MEAAEIKAKFPLEQFLRQRGVKLKGAGKVLTANECAWKRHGEAHWCVSIDLQKQVWCCHDCGCGGSVIDWVMGEFNIDFQEAIAQLDPGGTRTPYEPASSGRQVQPKESAFYDYTDVNGNLLFQVVRFIPKTFRQRHKGEKGEWVWSMDGVNRVLYHLPALLTADTVIIVEGEKDANNLTDLGHVATCNVGGAKKWLDSYSETLAGKNVWVWPDNDEPGQAHATLVIKSLAGKAKSISKVVVVEKDASAFIDVDPATAKERVMEALAKAVIINAADEVPIKSMLELERDYIEHVKRVNTTCLKLGEWLPSFNKLRPLVPGELVAILSDTGSGKTACLQHIARASAPLPTLMFELELPGALIFERFLQIDQGMTGEQVFNEYRNSGFIEFKRALRLLHVYCCLKSRMTVTDIEGIINRAEMKMGRRPVLVIVDYVGLVGAPGSSRYERLSDTAETLKIVAKSTETIIVFASQIARKGRDAGAEIALHDGKDSGAIESSAGLVLGVWRHGDNGDCMRIKILKNTKGRSGMVIECNFDGPTLGITERAPIEDKDVPHPYKD